MPGRERGGEGCESRNKREGREGRGWGSIRFREGEEKIKREGEVMKTGAMEMESLLIFRTGFLLFAHSLMDASLLLYCTC